jgi:signal transduction histidine kinase
MVPQNTNKLRKRYLVIQISFVLILGITTSAYVANKVAKREKDVLVNRVETIAKTIHRTPITKLHGDERDLKNNDYIYLKRKLSEIKSVNDDARFIYLMGYNKEVGKLFFFVDSEPTGSKDYSPPGQVYEESTPKQIDNYIRSIAFAEGPYNDRWGRWVSAYSPILSAETNLPIALIGIDVSASKFVKEVISIGIIPFLISLFVGLVFLIIYHNRINGKNNEINDIKLEFSSFISHEIRGFITTVKAGLSFLYQEEFGPVNAKQQSFINELLKSSDEFEELVRDFLDVAHLEQDMEIALKTEESNIIDILKSVESDAKDILAKKSLSIIHEGNLPEKVFVVCDSMKISRVLGNVLSNAIKYSPEHSSVRIGYIEGAQGHTIYIKDNGIGIPQKEQGDLFKKFYRASNARGVHISGTGLGLYFSRLIVEKHHGKIWFESTEGSGTTFFVSLPKQSNETKTNL